MAENPPEIAAYQNDHDLLVVLNERVGALTSAVTVKNNDHEQRIRDLEKLVWRMGGVASTIGIGAGYVWSLFT